MVNKLATLLIDKKAIEFGEFTLASGQKSTYYIDIKTASMQPDLLGPIAQAIAKRFSFDVVAGVAVGAIPLAVAVSLAAQKPCAVIRKEEKGHGKTGTIIGAVEGKQVLLVEDVTTSGGSVRYGLETLRHAGARVDEVVTVVDREEGAKDLLANDHVTLIPLVQVSELLDHDPRT
jgi:orotate phosphoribosyltransferase